MATSKLFTGTAQLTNLAQSKALSEVVVEVAAEPAKAKVVREGYQVPSAQLNVQATEFFLGNLEVVTPRLTPRVVGQSIKPGTKVTAGTVVDLVLAPAGIVPFDIFDNIHRDLRQRPVTALLDGLLADPTTRQAVLSYARPEDVPAADRERLVAGFAQAQVQVNDSNADTSFAAAFNAARSALAFK